MVDWIEEHTKQDFVEWFQAQGMLTEFILYSGWIQYQYGGFNTVYNISKSDVKWVFLKLYPRFKDFFNQLDVSGLDKEKALSEVFSIHQKKLVRLKWGFLSPIVNRLLDISLQSLPLISLDSLPPFHSKVYH
jgi:hypothetical protein